MSSLTDKQIACSVCGGEFTFTIEEQEFFASKGFQDPRKCKPCRDEAKKSRGRGDRQRQFFDVICAGCGIETQVPFRPNGMKPVYCRDCYQNAG